MRVLLRVLAALLIALPLTIAFVIVLMLELARAILRPPRARAERVAVLFHGVHSYRP